MQLFFKNIDGIGNLYLEKTFLKFEEENVLFICLDDAGNRYLSVCYEMRYALKWVLCRVSHEIIAQMLKKQVKVRECFERTENQVLLITYTEKFEETAEWKALREVDSNILPDKDFELFGNLRKE